MESSFFEYRDKTVAESDSDTDVIDDSLVATKSFTVVADSDTLTDDDTEEDSPQKTISKSAVRQSIAETHIIASSDDEEVSPEIVPKRRPLRPQSLNSTSSPLITRKVKKRMILIDSDTDNSILIEREKNIKLKCVKDTPLKIDTGKKTDKVNDSDMSDDDSGDSEAVGDEESDDESDKENLNKKETSLKDKANINNSKVNENNDSKITDDNSDTDEDTNNEANGDEAKDDENDDGPDEDLMVMSRATRMSIMGIIPKQNDSDESDFIQSDDGSKSRGSTIAGSTESLTDLPAVDLSRRISLKLKTPEKEQGTNDDSKLTCSPISSPLHNVTKELDNSHINSPVLKTNLNNSALKKKVLNNVLADDQKSLEDDDDVTVIDSKPEVITLSSDDEDEVQPTKKSPKKSPSLKKSPNVQKPKAKDGASISKVNTIRQYLPPASYPNQVVYVKKSVRENELNKLNTMQMDLQNIRHLLDTMDVETLPDGGARLIQRFTELQEDVRRQGDKVGNMVVEPERPSPAEVARDGFDQGLSWDDIQKASNAVQPRMFGKQAMATHLAERNLILDRLRDLHESLASRPPEEAVAKDPAALKTKLMPHQTHALAWLRWRETQNPPGGILADDMGLGKTITMISLIAGDKEHDNDDDDDDDDDDYDDRRRGKLVRGGTLVVCPASLMQQWAGEVQKHCRPHRVAVGLHHGAQRAAQPQRLAAHDLVLTTYNILQRESEKNGVLMRVQWRRVILDEAHSVRNHKSATSAAVSGLRARRRWALTGTPVHNKDLDLFALLKFLRCTPFDDLTMWKKWIDNKSLGGQERLSTIMRCILLRRTKLQLQQRGQLACLPERSAHHTPVTLAKEEMNVYQKVLVFSKTLFAQFLHQRAEKNSELGGFLPKGKDTEYDKMHKKMIALQGAKPVKSHEILVLLLRLRQVCCHCGLIAAMLDEEDAGAAVEDEGGKDLLAELNKLSLEDSRTKRKSGERQREEEEPGPEPEGTTAAEAIRSVLSPNNPVFDLARRSSKIKAVMDCLKKNVLKNKGEKAVVVSQWTSVLALVERELRGERVRCVTLSGAVPVPARGALVDALNDPNSDVRVMLLSLCAGGVGLNLCGASHLLLLDPHWNPQLEQQAQDRVYRVGQTRHVHIYRFMCVDTVEQSIRKLQEAKLELAENVLTGARHTASKLSIEDLKVLFNMGQPAD